MDCARFWEIVLTVGLAALVGGIAYTFRWYFYSQQQQRLHALALLRREGVGLRNDGKEKTLTGPAFDKWKADIEDWKDRLFTTATQFSPVEAERLDTLDWMLAVKFTGISNKDQLQTLRDLTETLKRLQQLLEDRVRPYFSP